MNVEEYALLVSEKNYERARYIQYVRAVLNTGVCLGSTAESFDLAFDLSNAAGEQLDIIGELVGIDRLLSYKPAEGDRIMDDDEFRLMIRLKIARNTWDGSNKSANETYGSVFGDISVTQTDNQDMTVSVVIYGDVSSRQAEILSATNNLLIPVGVGKTIQVVGGSINVNMETDAVISGSLLMDCVNAT